VDYLFHILVLVSVFTILSVSLDLLAGHTGILSIAHSAFCGIGAYTSALLVTQQGASFAVGIVTGMFVATIVSFIVSLPSLRLGGDYFVIAMFGFQMILFSLFNNCTELTGGPLGIPGIPPPVIFGWRVNSLGEFLILSWGMTALTYLIVYSVTVGPFGRVLHAIREDEEFAKAHGKNTLYFKVTAFAVSAALAAMAGSLYAHFVTYIDPTSFTVMESILIISMVIIGGAGSLWGPFVGALVLVTLPEALRCLGLPSAVAANLRQITYGSLLVIMMMFRPRGLVGKYSFAK
jgi:branched-chain amino acid transport system permease protein